MKKRLYKTWYISLTFIAGYLNLVGLAYFKVLVSHQTGNLTNMVLRLLEKNYELFIQLGLSLLGFILGAVTTGLLTKALSKKKGVCYGYLNIFSGLVLVVADLFWAGVDSMIFTIAYLLGLQNAIKIKENDFLIRTTHMSGNITDLSLLLVDSLTGQKTQTNKLKTIATLIITFLAGGLLGGLLAYNTKLNLIYIGAFMYLVASLIYKAYRKQSL